MAETLSVFAGPSPAIRRIEIDRPWAWLAAGWNDMVAAPRVSLLHGAIISGASIALAATLLDVHNDPVAPEAIRRAAEIGTALCGAWNEYQQTRAL
ncbi:MAG: hypothetical protein ACO3CS_12710, partial [Alphaproteobacteria bacterium]